MLDHCSKCGLSRKTTPWILVSPDERWHMNLCAKCWKDLADTFSPYPARKRREFTVISEDEIPEE